MGLVFLLSSCSTSRKTSSRSNGAGKASSSRTTTKSGKLRNSIATYAGRFTGTKYQYGGGTPKGFDCSGLTHYVFDEFNIELPRGSYNQAKIGKRISLNKTKPGDLVFFGKRGKVNHVALVVKNSSAGVEVIHSTSSRGVMKQNISKSTYWKPRILFARDVMHR